jgi:predicted alpha/beta-hydrolase family hydrolase
MATSTSLAIEGFGNEPVPNHLLRPDGAIDALAVLLPGFGYTLDMPLFYYAENLLLERGWDVLRVEYAYNRLPEAEVSPRSKIVERLYTDSMAAWQAGLGQRQYQRVALIGKSLGTLAMGHLLTAAEPPPRTSAVWVTPLLSVERLRGQIGDFGGPSLFVVGTADEEYDGERLDALVAATNGEAVVVEGADHGMDVPGDPIASIQAMERFTAVLGRFL